VRPILVLAGTTAVGKTEVSIPLAEALNGEIISADSRQIYRELNIGTAKPSTEQRARVPHHFIDERSIHDRWTAGDFSREARVRIPEILARGRLPMIVGGSMLYLRALLDGFYEEDVAGGYDYEQLRQEWENGAAESLYEELQRCDPDLAGRTNPRDHHRILRGVLVWRLHHMRLSDLQQAPRQPMPDPFRLYFLHGDRQHTYTRVNERVLLMLKDGLVEEVQGLAEQGLTDRNCNALLTHGYQEVFPYLRGEISRDKMIDEIQKAVRHYVKRQVTWFRRDERVHWILRRFDEPPEIAAQQIAEDYTAAMVT
jgi:tRNA dimethylallyltransferase